MVLRFGLCNSLTVIISYEMKMALLLIHSGLLNFGIDPDKNKNG